MSKILYRTSVNKLCFYKDIFLKVVHMYVCTFKVLIVTRNPSISKATCTCLAPFLLPVTHPFLRITEPRLQGHTVYGPWFSRIFQRVGVIMNIKQFDVLVDSKLSIIRYLFFYFIASLLYAVEQRRLD